MQVSVPKKSTAPKAPEHLCIHKTRGKERIRSVSKGRKGLKVETPARARRNKCKSSLPYRRNRGPKQRVTALGTAHSRTAPGKAGTGLVSARTKSYSPQRRPPHSLHLPEWQGPPLVVGDRAMAPCAPPPLRLPGQRAPAVAAGGCQHPLSRGAPAEAPTLPPSQALTRGCSSCSVPGSRNLRGASLGSRAPHYCFISQGPAKNNAGHETEGT